MYNLYSPKANNGFRSIVVTVLSKAGLFHISPRPPQTLRLFSPYDANIIGGLLIGLGMALTGACPGTLLPQVVLRLTSALLALVGAILGGLLWVLASPRIERSVANVSQNTWSLHYRFGQSREVTAMAVAASCVTVAYLSTAFDGRTSTVTQGLVGGLALGASQAGSIFLTQNSIGSSAAYEEAGKWIVWRLQGAKDARPPHRSIAFAGGALLGSWIYAQLYNISVPRDTTISAFSALTGGVCLSFGARLAGGCTSGHGISGMAMMSTASFVSVAAMFGGGMVAASFV